jgi:signal transduction histidine kinase
MMVSSPSATHAATARPSAAVRAFADAAAHAMAEPLLMLQMQGEVLSDTAAAAVSRLTTVNEGIVRLAAAEADPLPEPVELDDALRGALRRVGTLRERKPRVVATGLPVVQADPWHVATVLLELLCNVVDHAGAGATVQVREVPAERGMCAVAVTDDGRGAPPEQLPSAVKPFKRLVPRETPDRAGVGLAVVQRLVETNGGELSLDAAPGSFSAVCSFPAAR